MMMHGLANFKVIPRFFVVSIRQTLKYNNQATNGSFSACHSTYTLNTEKNKRKFLSNAC
jgi:hypothetical protein